jgi:hypothetical protein
MTSKALGNAFNLRDVVNPKNPTYGAKDDGSTDATAGIQAAFDSQVASVGKVVIPGRLAGAGNFLISGTIDYDNPSFSLVDMQGAKVTASHDGIAFNLNPAADPSAPNSTMANGRAEPCTHRHGDRGLPLLMFWQHQWRPCP